MSRRLLFALLAMSCAQAAVYIARPMTSYRLLGLGAGVREVGLVTACFALLPLFLAIPLGRHADRHHGARLLGAGCAIQLAACLLLAWARTPLALAGASAVLGLGHLALALGVQAVIALESDDEHHDRHFGLLGVAVSLGQLVGPLVGGVVVGDRSGGALTAATGRAMLVAAGFVAVATAFGLLAESSRAVRSAAGPERPRDPLLGILATRGMPGGDLRERRGPRRRPTSSPRTCPSWASSRGSTRPSSACCSRSAPARSMASRLGIGGLVRRVGRLRLITLSAVAAAVGLVGMTFSGDVSCSRCSARSSASASASGSRSR